MKRVIASSALAAGFAVSLFSAPMVQAETALPAIKMDQALHDRLPADIQKSGVMHSVQQGSFPPYTIVDGTKNSGAATDMGQAVGKLLGVKVTESNVAGLPALLTGINSGRYQFSMGPIGDFASREKSADFVDWVEEHVVFAVQKGNPKKIDGLDTVCGKRIAVMSGGSAERVIKGQSDKCVANGEKAVAVQSYTDQPSSILAVRSHRADAFFSSEAPLSYFVQQSHGQLELAGMGHDNGFGTLHQGAVVAKGDALGQVLVDAINELIKNGTYAAIMKKWHLDGNMTDTVVLNASGAAK